MVWKKIVGDRGKMSENTNTSFVTAMNSPADLKRENQKSDELAYFEIWIVLLALIDLKKIIYVFLFLATIGTAYFIYLDSLYKIDLVMEVPLMRILSLAEKFTVRVNGCNCGSSATKEFIKYYSACESVALIQLQCDYSITESTALQELNSNYRTSVMKPFTSSSYDLYMAHSDETSVPTAGLISEHYRICYSYQSNIRTITCCFAL